MEQDYGYWVNLGDAWEEQKLVVHGTETTSVRRSWRWEATCNNFSTFECGKCSYGTIISHIVGVEPAHAGRSKRQALRSVTPADFASSIVPAGVRSDAIQIKDPITIPQPSWNLISPPYMAPPEQCLLPRLNDDVIYEIITSLPSETLLSFAAAYTRAHDLMSRYHVLLLRELRCFFLRCPLTECILGIGVHFDEDTRLLSSDFDWLSQEAFTDFKVRRSIQKHYFGFFLPLAFSRTHFSLAVDSIWRRLRMLDDQIQKSAMKRRFSTRVPRVHAYEAVRVIYQFMNNIVVALMQSTDAVMSKDVDDDYETLGTSLLLASERAVVSYCQLYHLLLSLAASEPRVLGEATTLLKRFLSDPKARTKRHVPDMGELIVMASLVLGCSPMVDGRQQVTWRYHLNGPVLEEVFIRNARWTLKDHPELEVLEEGISEYRLIKTFESAKTTLRYVPA